MTLYERFGELISPYVTRFAVSLVILLVGFILAKIAGKIVHKVLSSLELNKTLSELTNTKIAVEGIAEAFTTYFLYFITIVIVLQHLGLATTVLNMIAGAVLIIIILSTLFGIKDIIPNAVAGIMMRQKKSLHVGEIIKVKGMRGKVVAISLIETKIETPNKDLIFIPNSVLIKTEVVKIREKKS